MSELKEAQVGRREKKGDIFVRLEKRESGGVEIELTSSVEAMFGGGVSM